MLRGSSICVVVPAFRVAAQIGDVVRRMPAFVDRVIVVDDACPEESGDSAAKVADPRVTVVRHRSNQGVGGAMATGFQAALEAGLDVVAKCDGDGQMDPEDLPLLLDPLLDGQAEYAKGCRFHHADELRRMPVARLAGNIGLTFLTKLASGYWHVLDPQNGFVAIDAATLRQLPIAHLARDYFFENDMLIRLNVLGARVIDVALPARYGTETSSLSPWRTLASFPARLLRGFVRRIVLKHFVYDVTPTALFGLTGLTLLACGSAFGLYHWIRSALEHHATPAGTVILAAVPLILGFELVLRALVFDIESTPRPARPRRRGTRPAP
jgi:glycosyltransferase involved in cell wall biosynthesis